MAEKSRLATHHRSSDFQIQQSFQPSYTRCKNQQHQHSDHSDSHNLLNSPPVSPVILLKMPNAATASKAKKAVGQPINKRRRSTVGKYPSTLFLKANKHQKRAKQAPVCPRGTKMLWNDNDHIDHSVLKVGVPQPKKLRVELFDTTGRSWLFKYPKRSNFDWSNKAAVKAAGAWRKQIFSRRLIRGADNPPASRISWTEAGKENIRMLVKEHLESVPPPLA